MTTNEVSSPPMTGERVPVLRLLESFSTALDLVSPALLDHHRKTAWLTHRIGKTAGVRGLELRTAVFAALLHDIGCLSLAERFRCLEFESSFDEVERTEHAEVGYHLLRGFEPFADIAQVVRYQHAWWDAPGEHASGDAIPAGSHLLHLADRISICLLAARGSGKLVRDDVRLRVERESGRMFRPDLVQAFLDDSDDWGWNELACEPAPSLTTEELPGRSMVLGDAELRALARLFSHIIDFRSLHTATHSSGVAATSEVLADRAGFSRADSSRMFIAGLLHDLGKIAVPAELLDKPGRLNPEEYERVKAHAAFTARIVEPLGELGGIRAWAAEHHERSDGSGYPRGLAQDSISFGGRILAVADVFTALTESRPYRRGLSRDEALREIAEMTGLGHLDPAIVTVLVANSIEIDGVRATSQAKARDEYDEFRRRAGV